MGTVLVSAFIDLKRGGELKSLNDYLKYCEPLLLLDHKKIIFIEDHIIPMLPKCHPSTIIIPFSKDDLWYKYTDVKLPTIRNEKKDTLEYLKIQLNKTDWILRASDLLPEHRQFIWVDFGIGHVCKNPNWTKLLKEYDKIRIPGCRNPDGNTGIDTNMINWFFCGGLLGGNIEKIRLLDIQTKNMCNFMGRRKEITWEVNIWLLVWHICPEIFDWYYSDHDSGMINNY